MEHSGIIISCLLFLLSALSAHGRALSQYKVAPLDSFAVLRKREIYGCPSGESQCPAYPEWCCAPGVCLLDAESRVVCINAKCRSADPVCGDSCCLSADQSCHSASSQCYDTSGGSNGSFQNPTNYSQVNNFIPGVASGWQYFPLYRYDQIISEYGFIEVSSTPTPAAMIPLWPEYLVSLILCWIFIVSTLAPQDQLQVLHNRGDITAERLAEDLRAFHPLKGTANICFTLLKLGLFTIWVVAFVIVAKDRTVGGWSSVLNWAGMYTLGVTCGRDVSTRFQRGFYRIVYLFAFFGWCGTIFLIAGRWNGLIGSIAYQIQDLNGCTLDVDPSNPELVGGYLSRTMKIMQTTNFCLVSVYVFVSPCLLFKKGKPVWWTALALSSPLAMMYMIELIYLATVLNNLTGRPFFLSGNCMLVESSPKMGYFDSKVEMYWKGIVGVLGL